MIRIPSRRALGMSVPRFAGVARSPRALSSQRWSSSNPTPTPSPPSPNLEEQLQKAIDVTGPISLAKYMRQCLTSMDRGYYSRTPAEAEQIGGKGDFVTSPEISQVFGELVGIWIVSEWMAQGQKSSGVHLVEFGPGKGTLMDDILRTLRHFPTLFKSIEGITLVESSENLREMQSKRLCPIDATLEYDAAIAGYKSVSKYSADIPVTWTSETRYLPNGKDITPFVIAHEFFDALPIHAFQSVVPPPPPPEPTSTKSSTETSRTAPRSPPRPQRNRWRELLVDSRDPPSDIENPSSSAVPTKGDKFQLRLASQDTPHSLLLPLESPRYQALLDQPAGSTIEISPESLSLARQIAILIGGSSSRPAPRPRRSPSGENPEPPPYHPPTRDGPPSGAALIVDYGPESHIPVSTLRGIRAHALTSPFDSPGLVDLSADVDFGALVEAALAASEDVEAHGPVPQGFFLKALGGQERVEMLMKTAKDEEARESVRKSWDRLVSLGPKGMGGIYKALAILPRKEGQEGRRPVGFGGGVIGYS